MSGFVHVIPQKGVVYRTAKEVMNAFADGKDFLLQDPSSPWDGKPCSRRDFKGKTVYVNYGAFLERVLSITVR